MRVIAGQFRSRPLKSLAGMDTRPTSDKLRETLFNVLTAGNPDALGGSIWLDVFAGTGAIGIEALSRGAAAVTFVERDRRAQALVAENLARCGVTDGYVIIRASVARALGDLAPASFDIMFLDPPYDEGVDDVLAAAGERLDPGGGRVVEHARRRTPAAAAGRLARTREVTSGDSALSFYEAVRS